MYSRWQLAIKYLHSYLTASNSRGHGIHSAFVFDLITKVFNDKKYYPAYDKVEGLRKQLLKPGSEPLHHLPGIPPSQKNMASYYSE
jgi:hypothetical protein